MRSKHADYFNHDADSVDYDEDVRNEKDPIRAGYAAVLDWVIASAQITKHSTVLDLGSGTGNLSKRIPTCQKLVCVDVSQKMTEKAKKKLRHLSSVSYVQADVLEYFENCETAFDAILSTYTIHHLLEEEKEIFFEEVYRFLKPGGHAVFGDLMIEKKSMLEKKIHYYKEKVELGVVDGLTDEYFWYVDTAEEKLRQLGFAVTTKRFSDLSFGILATKAG